MLDVLSERKGLGVCPSLVVNPLNNQSGQKSPLRSLYGKYREIWILPIFDFPPHLDFWICGNCSQTYFKISIFEKYKQIKNVEIVDYKMTLLPVLKSRRAVRLCRSCLRRFGDLRKNTPLDFWSMYWSILWILLFFDDFRVPH